jgi:hypothetical protein
VLHKKNGGAFSLRRVAAPYRRPGRQASPRFCFRSAGLSSRNILRSVSPPARFFWSAAALPPLCDAKMTFARSSSASIPGERTTRLWPSSSLPAVANVFLGAGGKSASRDEEPLLDCYVERNTPPPRTGLASVAAAFRPANCLLRRGFQPCFCSVGIAFAVRLCLDSRRAHHPPLAVILSAAKDLSSFACISPSAAAPRRICLCRGRPSGRRIGFAVPQPARHTSNQRRPPKGGRHKTKPQTIPSPRRPWPASSGSAADRSPSHHPPLVVIQPARRSQRLSWRRREERLARRRTSLRLLRRAQNSARSHGFSLCSGGLQAGELVSPFPSRPHHTSRNTQPPNA